MDYTLCLHYTKINVIYNLEGENQFYSEFTEVLGLEWYQDCSFDDIYEM
jgi:hypothetical protein